MYPGARVPALSRVAAALLVLAACAAAPAGSPPQPPAVATAPAGPRGQPTRILAAHAQSPAPGAARDFFGVPVGALVYLLFSRPLDPASLVPSRFVVLAHDGTRRVPVAASLAPASERDELRALELVIPAPQRELISVTLVGQLFDVDGRELDGLSFDILPADAPPVPVLAEHMSQGTECPGGHASAVRVWWSAPVGAGVGGVRLMLRDGQALAPTGLADVACLPGVRLAEGGPACDIDDDSVLDFCAPGGAVVDRIELDSGAAKDRHGRPSAPGTLVLTDMSNGT